MNEYIHVIDSNSVNKYNKLLDNHKDVIVLYYMDNCYYCDILKPEWSKFEEHAKKKNNFKGVIAKINSKYINDVNGYKEIMGYPTIYRLNNKNKESEFDGERTLEGLTSFLNETINKENKTMKGGKRKTKKRRTKTKKRRTKTKSKTRTKTKIKTKSKTKSKSKSKTKLSPKIKTIKKPKSKEYKYVLSSHGELKKDNIFMVPDNVYIHTYVHEGEILYCTKEKVNDVCRSKENKSIRMFNPGEMMSDITLWSDYEGYFKSGVKNCDIKPTINRETGKVYYASNPIIYNMDFEFKPITLKKVLFDKLIPYHKKNYGLNRNNTLHLHLLSCLEYPESDYSPFEEEPYVPFELRDLYKTDVPYDDL